MFYIVSVYKLIRPDLRSTTLWWLFTQKKKLCGACRGTPNNFFLS